MPTQPERTITAEPLSARNPRLKRLRKLVTQRKARSAERAFVAEGPTLLTEALRSNAPIIEVYVDAELVLDPTSEQGLFEIGVPAHPVQHGVLASMLDAATPQGVATVVGAPDTRLTADRLAEVPTDAPVLVLHDLRDPGNVGTLLRTAEASGFGAVAISGDSVEVFNPKAVRASAGSIFRVPLFVEPDTGSTFDAVRGSGRAVLATVVSDGDPHHDVDLTRAAIVLGSEAHGLSPEVVGVADAAITIELAGPTESLNVAAAGAIICFESLRQRRTAAINSFDSTSPTTESSGHD